MKKKQIEKLTDAIIEMRNSAPHAPLVVEIKNDFLNYFLFQRTKETKIVCDINELKSWCDKPVNGITDGDCEQFARHLEGLTA